MEKINRKKLILYLEKINLGGLVQKILIVNKDKKTITKADDGVNLTVTCENSTNIFGIDENIAIYDVQQFLRYINLLDTEEVSYRLSKTEKDDKNYKIILSSGSTNIEYMLSDEENIPVAREMKKDPRTNLHFRFKVNSELATSITKAMDVTGSKVIYFVKTKKGLVLNVGDVMSKEHMAKIRLSNVEELNKLPEANGETVDKICFESSYLRNILNINKAGIIELAMDGVMIFENTEDNINITYLQRSLKLKKV